jgi:plastocyanin
MMRKAWALAAACLLVGTGCLGGGGATATILVDYSHDEFASFIAENFPGKVSVHPGAELVFKQTWTGEPHSVTGGTLADELMEKVRPFMEKADRGEEIPEEPPKDIAKLEERLPWTYGEDEQADFNQTAAQPCYLSTGLPPTNGKPCKTQKQPLFNGRQSYFNSGLIPYQGPQGDEHRVKLADTIKPGSYWFYCNVHGEFQSTEVVVKARNEKVDTQSDINRRAQMEVNKTAKSMLEVYNDAREDNEVSLKMQGEEEAHVLKGNFAGLFDPSSYHWHSINEFIPRRMTVDAGEEITWNLIAFHTISFGVPKYFPILTFEKDGSVKRNPKLDPPAGGAKKYNEPEQTGPPGDEPVRFDGGSYDGDGFWSSGSMAAEPYLEYTMRITEPGTYRYACLIHPPMVGTVVVS